MKKYKWLASVAIAVTMTLFGGTQAATAAGSQKQLFIFNWSQYMDPAIIKAFEKKYDVKVTRTFYDSLPEMFAKLRAGGDGQFDIVVPSTYYVPRLIKTGLVQPLNHDLIPNLKHLMPEFTSPSYDPGNKYTAAYQWGTTGLAYNKKQLKDAIPDWGILFDPKVNPKYPFVLGTDAMVVFGSACAYLGYGYPCQTNEQYKKAAKLVMKTKKRPNFAGFMDNTPMLHALARGTVSAGMSYNGDYVFDVLENPKGFKNTRFAAPNQGAELWVDSMMIPAHAPHPDLANKFINFILDPAIGAQLSEYNMYATPNKASLSKVRDSLRKPPIMPRESQLKNYHYSPSLEGKKLQFVQQLWTAVKSS